jgi:uncharacterized damage-inducible protein DinB
MIALETLRELFEYNYWARDRQLQTCATLTPEQFLRPMGNSFASLRDTLVHLLAVEWVWKARCRGASPTAREAEAFAPEKYPALSSIQERWPGVERDMRQYLDELREEALPEPLTYTNLKGERRTYPLWRVLLHLINHQSYHRGEVTTLLRQLGAEPPQIDYLVAIDVGFKR